jgi:hypothetical protein
LSTTISPHLASLHHPSTAVSSLPIAHFDHKSPNPYNNPAPRFVIIAQNLVSRSIRDRILHLNPSEPTHPSKPPRLPYLASTSPPTLTLFSPSLAPKRPPHAHLVDRPARRAGLVPCVVLLHGLAGLALRRTLWRKPANRYDERLNWELLLLLYCACGMYGMYVFVRVDLGLM